VLLIPHVAVSVTDMEGRTSLFLFYYSIISGRFGAMECYFPSGLWSYMYTPSDSHVISTMIRKDPLQKLACKLEKQNSVRFPYHHSPRSPHD